MGRPRKTNDNLLSRSLFTDPLLSVMKKERKQKAGRPNGAVAIMAGNRSNKYNARPQSNEIYRPFIPQNPATSFPTAVCLFLVRVTILVEWIFHSNNYCQSNQRHRGNGRVIFAASRSVLDARRRRIDDADL